MARTTGWLAPIGHMPDPGDIIGTLPSGKIVRLVGGGAAANLDTWIPEEYSGEVIQRVQRRSTVEALARRWPMANDVRHVPRSAGMAVAGIAKGGTYAEDTSTNDEVLLTAQKIGQAIRLNDEDLKDNTLVDVLNVKKMDWATSYSTFFDNACLGTTAAQNGTTVLYTSVYKAIRTTNASTGYTADTNYVASASGGVVSYDNLSDLLSRVEGSDYWDDGEALVIAHPAFKKSLRGIKDSQNRPIFVRGQGPDGRTPDTLFEYPISWALGAKTSATNMATPNGNPLIIVCNRQFLYRGDRSGPESVVAGADTGIGFLTDQALLKMRSRRAFAVAHENAFAVLERMP